MSTSSVAIFALIAAMRFGSVTRSTMCSTPSTVTDATASPGSVSSSVRPSASDSPQIGDMLARVARGEIEAIGRGLGGDPLMGEDPALAVGSDLEPTEDADDAPWGAARVGESQSVEGECGLIVERHHAGVDPLSQRLTGSVVAPGTRGLPWNIDMRDVESVAQR